LLIIYSSLKNIQYIIYDSKQIGKEYEVFHVFHNVLMYEGEYLNGERNGKGKECWLGSVIFEGEYYKGKRHGKGKQYRSDHTLQFEAIYLNGQKNGKGKEYYRNSKIKFDGEYLNDKELIGNKYNEDGKIEYKLNNNINGNGLEYYVDTGKKIWRWIFKWKRNKIL